MSAKAQKILTSLAVKYDILVDGKMIECFSLVSIGCKLFIDDQETPGNLLKLADMSMYRAKKFGVNQSHILDK